MGTKQPAVLKPVLVYNNHVVQIQSTVFVHVESFVENTVFVTSEKLTSKKITRPKFHPVFLTFMLRERALTILRQGSLPDE